MFVAGTKEEPLQPRGSDYLSFHTYPYFPGMKSLIRRTTGFSQKDKHFVLHFLS